MVRKETVDWQTFDLLLDTMQEGLAGEDTPDGYYRREGIFRRTFNRPPDYTEIRRLANPPARLRGDDLDYRTLGGLGPETDVIHPSPVERSYDDGLPDAPNPEDPDDDRASVPATTHGFGSKIMYEGEVIETWP